MGKKYDDNQEKKGEKEKFSLCLGKDIILKKAHMLYLF